MSKPNVTLEPSKGIVSEAAARIYSAYIAAGVVEDDDTDTWIKRAIREAIIIAKTVDASVDSQDTVVVGETTIIRSRTDSAKQDRESKKPQTKKKKTRSTRKGKHREKKEAIEKLAEEVLTEEPPKHDPPLLELDDELGESHAEDSPIDAEKGRSGQSEDKDDSAAVAEEALRRMSKTSTKLPAKT